MKDSKSKIRLTYLYRDAGNYKQFGEVVYSNKYSKPVSELKQIIGSKLIDSEFFDSSKSLVPVITSFPYDSDLDHSWYEFNSLEEVVSESDCGNDIQEFIDSL